MTSNQWDDHYAKKARAENWRARSVYKLEEINDKIKLFKPGDKVLDLGCYPGSWSQYVLSKISSSGKLIGIDLKKPKDLPTPSFRFIQEDIFNINKEVISSMPEAPFSVVLSDMAPSTTGIRNIDTSRSIELALKALEIAIASLVPKGKFLCKILEGEDIKIFINQLNSHFSETRLFRPKATRKRSTEVFVYANGFIGERNWKPPSQEPSR